MVIRFGEYGLAYLRICAVYQWQQRLALQPVRPLYISHGTDRWKEIDMADEAIYDLAAFKTARTAHDQHHPHTVIRQIALHTREGNAVVRGAND